MPYLSKQALSGLKHYHYKPGGYTILDNWHQPLWNCEFLRGWGWFTGSECIPATPLQGHR